MNKTYKMMIKVSENINEEDEDLLVEMYKSGRDSEVLAKLFVLNYGMINKISNKYMSIDTNRAESIALDSLEEAINEYSIDGNAKLSTFFFTIYKRNLIDEYRKIKANKRQINEESESVDELTNGENGEFGITYKNNNIYHENKLDIDFYELDFLTENEKKILTYYKENNSKCNQKDVAEALDVKPSSISRALKRLEDKKEQLKEVLFNK